jgi:hypothetical protein
VILFERVLGVDNETNKATVVSAARKESVNTASTENGTREARHSQDIPQGLADTVKAKLHQVYWTFAKTIEKV